MASSNTEAPYISIVAVSRNSAGSGDLRAFAESWNRSAARFGLSLELIVVTCGPLDAGVSGVRLIEAPADIPESTARNAGIRRARGEFILSTETDVVVSGDLMQFLASRQLRKGCLYRIDRHDGRLHAREGTFHLTADGLRENQPQDITAAQSGVHFGDGWFPAERDSASGELFRWIENAAEVNLRIPAGAGALELELEPGPGVGPLPQVLQVLDRTGDVVAEWTVAGRILAKLWVPQDAQQSFRLSVPDGGRPLINDLRILNFRFFRCDWAVAGATPPPRSYSGMRPTLTRLVIGGGILRLQRAVRLLSGVGDDIFGAGIEHWGQGWHRLEEAGTERFRWVSTGAELVVRIEAVQRDLCLLVEPGPSLNGRPFHLMMRLAGGKVFGNVRVAGLTLVRVPIPVAAGTVATIVLSPDTQGAPLPGDSRVLNFRVLACACETSERPLPPAELASPPTWTAVTVSEKPPGIDWPARLQRYRRELAEMGKPAFLHVNACDFVLMDRERWFDVRGYPETNDLTGRLNTILCYTAHFAGAREVVLREPLRIDRAPSTGQPPVAPGEDLIWLIAQMRRLRAPAIMNLDTWGLKDSALRETGAALPAYATGSEE